MASFSIEQKSVDENNESIEKLNILFEQVEKKIKIIDETGLNNLSSVSIDNDVISSGKNDSVHYSGEEIVNMFDNLIKTYLQLLDSNQFISLSVDRYLYINNRLTYVFTKSSKRNGMLQHFQKMTCKVQQKLYYKLLDQISSSSRIISFLKNELSLPSDIKDENKRIVTNSCALILTRVLRVLISLKVTLINIELEKSEKTLFSTFIGFINQYFMENKCSENNILINAIADYFIITSRQTSILPILINANCSQICLQWLSLLYLSGDEYDNIITILYNIARHDEGALILTKFECQKVLYQFEREILNNNIDFIINKTMYSRIQLILNMIIVLIVDSDKLPIDTVKIIMTWFSLTKKISFSKSSVATTYQFHISEILIVIMKLCVTDTCINYIFEQDQVIEFFFTALEGILPIVENTNVNDSYHSQNALTVIVLANIIWSISFHDQYKNHLIQNIKLINQLNKVHATGIIDKILVNSFIPLSMATLRRAIDGILHNLYPPSFSQWVTRLSNFSYASKSSHSLMISYSHVNIDFCKRLYDALDKDPLLSISFDINNNKYVWKEVAQTIERSDLLLFLISKDFFYSKSCRQELFYAIDTLKKSFIAIFIDDDYQATGWLNNRLTKSKHIRFGRTDFMHTCNELSSMIHEILPPINISSPNKTITVIKKWNAKEVQQWFINNNIICELFEFYQFQNGGELLLYAKSTLAYPWIKEYERIRFRFEERFKHKKQSLSQNQFLQFINALERLGKES